MKAALVLLSPRLWGARNRFLGKGRRSGIGWDVFLGVLGLAFWVGAYWVGHRVLVYFKGIEDIGNLIVAKLLSMVLVTVFALLFFSAILQSLSKLYLSRDLLLIHAFPVPAWKIFTSRWLEIVLDSSWMVLAFSLPFFAAYGVVFKGGPFYFFALSGVLAALTFSACSLSSLAVLAAVNLIPANRMRAVFIFLGVMVFISVYVAIRLLKPEQLVDPEAFDSMMVYIASLDTPASPLLPTTWGYDALRLAIDRKAAPSLIHQGLLWCFAGFWFCLSIIGADCLYAKGVTKAQTGGRRLLKTSRWSGFYWLPLPGDVKAIVSKEIKMFFRDQAQWSQLFLIGALILVYTYNFAALPLDKSPIQTIYLQNLLGFFNMGLALFVLTAVTARFAYPAVSTEREAFWLILSAPTTLHRFLWVKFFVYCLPLMAFTEILVIVTNWLLQVSAFMMWLSAFSVFAMVPGVVALGVGIGAAFPDFKAENPAQSVTGYGGALYMILSAVFIGMVIAIQAGPVYAVFMADLKDQSLNIWQQAWIWGSIFLSLAICSGALYFPMAFGVRRLSELRA